MRSTALETFGEQEAEASNVSADMMMSSGREDRDDRNEALQGVGGGEEATKAKNAKRRRWRRRNRRRIIVWGG
jgi:hypothetical protein